LKLEGRVKRPPPDHSQAERVAHGEWAEKAERAE
jgi:hypothetical protein